jgi:hypothetical protein
MAQPRSGRPHKLPERDCRVLGQVERKYSLSSFATVITEFTTASGSNVSTRCVHQELHEMGFRGRAAAHKPKITMRNAKRRLEWCGAQHRWTLEHAFPSGSPTDKSGFGARRTLPAPMHSANCKVWWRRNNGLFFMVRVP